MKPFVIALTALVLSAAGTGAAFAYYPIGTSVLDAVAPADTTQCTATPESQSPWTKADVAHLMSFMHVPYDSIKSTPGDCMTVAIRGHDGMLDQDVLNPATLTQVL